MYSKVIKSGTNRKLVYEVLLVIILCSNFCRITHRLREIWCETVKWLWNIAKSHRHSYLLEVDIWFLISNFSFCGRILYNFRYIELGRVKWPSNIIQGHQKWHQSKAAVWFPIVVYSNFCRITHRSWEIWCETVKWPWNIAKVIDTHITWKLSCGHVCKMFGRQWMKEAKIAVFNYPLSFNAPSPVNPREYLHKPYTVRNYVPWVTFLSLTVYG